MAGTKVGPDQLGPASPGRINSDQLGSTRIMKKKKQKIRENWNFYLFEG